MGGKAGGAIARGSGIITKPMGGKITKAGGNVANDGLDAKASNNENKFGSGTDFFGAPSFVNEDGTLKDAYKMSAGNYDLGGKYLQALGTRATEKGPSTWANMQNQNIDLQASGLRDQNASDAATALGTGTSNLAQTGGLDSGARERMASSTGLAQLQGNQSISKDAVGAKLNTGIEDERQKLGILQQMPGMMQNQAGFRANIDSKNIDRATNSQLFNYGEKMKAYTGEQMADATSAAGGKGKK